MSDQTSTSSVKEEEVTVRKDQDGKVLDLSKDSLAAKGQKHLSREEMLDLFSKIRLRISLTPKCNSWCVFCSNEGSSYADKFNGHADIDLVIKLCEMLIKSTTLKMIDFSGGEPTIHPDFTSGDFKLVDWTKKYPQVRFSIHSNGIALTPTIIDRIKDSFSRLGVSVNSFVFPTWNKISNLNDYFKEDVQAGKFKKLHENLEYLTQQQIGDKVFIKSVIMRGINDSEEELKLLLDYCATNNFHPKFLEFEPQFSEQKKYIVGRKEFFEKLEKLGCVFPPDAPRHNDPNTYIPGTNFTYRNVGGLHSIFGCGQKAACLSCYNFLCMFIKPTNDGKGVYIKPCAVLDTKIDLTHAIETENYEELFDLFRISREYLMLAPGMNCAGWNKEEKFKYC